jgi:hypothetical protein
LLCGAGIGFAFFLAGPSTLVRSIILGAVTVLAGLTGAMLKRAGLRSTGEAMASLTATLALLTWAVGTNGIEASLAVRGAWWGGLLLAISIILVAAGRRFKVIAWESSGLVLGPIAALFLIEIIQPYPMGLRLRAGIALIVMVLLAALSRKLAGRAAERITLTVISGIGLGLVSLFALTLGQDIPSALMLLAVAGAALAIGQEQRRIWAFPAGAAIALAGAAAIAPLWRQVTPDAPLMVSGFGALAASALLACVAAWFAKPAVLRHMVAGAVLITVPHGVPALFDGAVTTVFGQLDALTGPPPGLVALGGWVPTAAFAILGLFGRPRWFRAIAYWACPLFAAAALTTSATVLPIPGAVTFAILSLTSLGAAGIAYWATWRPWAYPRLRRAMRWTGWIVSLSLVGPITFQSVNDRPLIAIAGLVVPAAILANGLSMHRFAWPALAGPAYVYFIIDLGNCLHWALPNPTETLAATGIAAGLILTVFTWLRRPRLVTWAVLAGISLATVAMPTLELLSERTWWGAAAALSASLAAAIITLGRRRALPLGLRAAGSVVAVITGVFTLTAFLALVTPGSASLWAFPLIALVAATSAAGGSVLRARWPRRGPRVVGATLIWTGAGLGLVTVLGTLQWPVTGAQTVLAVAAVLAAGAAAVASIPGGSRQAWWYMGAMTCVTLWSALTMGHVGAVEAYTLPPAIGAAVAGSLLSLRHRGYLGLLGSGAGLAILPPLFLLSVPDAQLARSFELVAIAAVAMACAMAFDHLRRTLAWAMAGAGFGAMIAGWMIASLPSGIDSIVSGRYWTDFAELAPLETYPSVLFAVAMGFGLAGAASWAVAGKLLVTPKSKAWARWWAMPALAAAAITLLTGVRTTWPVIVTLWVAMACYLAATMFSARFEVRGRALMPPAWAIWLLAVAVGIGGWSPRELRVEWFALPLGLGLFAAGLVLGGKAAAYRNRAMAVAPGVAATLGPSTLAVGTDPQTWRAILVLVLALAFVLAAVRERWRSVVFICASSMILSLALVLLRHGSISIVPWLLALLAVGGCLLTLALVSERRSGKPGSVKSPPTAPTGQPPAQPGSPSPVPAASPVPAQVAAPYAPPPAGGYGPPPPGYPPPPPAGGYGPPPPGYPLAPATWPVPQPQVGYGLIGPPSYLPPPSAYAPRPPGWPRPAPGGYASTPSYGPPPGASSGQPTSPGAPPAEPGQASPNPPSGDAPAETVPPTPDATTETTGQATPEQAPDKPSSDTSGETVPPDAQS